MNNKIADHLFEFWSEVSELNQTLYCHKGYHATNTNQGHWPFRIFNVVPNPEHLKALHIKMSTPGFPDVLSVPENQLTEERLKHQGFKLKSEVTSMALLMEDFQPIALEEEYASIVLVDCKSYAQAFATIASKAFGYSIPTQHVLNLVNKTSKLQLYIGKYQGEFASCGVVFLDKNGQSGLHMIGTLPTHRGLGLGKQMTKKLLNQAKQNKSTKTLLVASKAGAHIYSKLGFKAKGILKSYTV